MSSTAVGILLTDIVHLMARAFEQMVRARVCVRLFMRLEVREQLCGVSSL